tara:strand:- start:129 stop:590 length:462 start_codon:yes stop_codon:yes gene_type:complete
MSAESWKDEVTKRRGEYSVRLKSAHHTREKGCSSWPTPAAHEARLGYQNRNNGKKGTQKSLTTVVIEDGQTRQDPNSTNGKSQELWGTPTATSRPPRSEETMAKCLKFRKSKGKNSVPLYLGEQAGGRLNPNWVEQLMGLPVGWTQLPAEWID